MTRISPECSAPNSGSAQQPGRTSSAFRPATFRFKSSSAGRSLQMPRVPRLASTLLIVVIAATLGLVATWRAPGLDRYARDWLMRTRGPMPAPNDIAIVAIDESSIRHFGRFPWRRSIMARAVERIAEGQPKVIALDVLYTDPSNEEDDLALA